MLPFHEYCKALEFEIVVTVRLSDSNYRKQAQEPLLSSYFLSQPVYFSASESSSDLDSVTEIVHQLLT